MTRLMAAQSDADADRAEAGGWPLVIVLAEVVVACDVVLMARMMLTVQVTGHNKARTRRRQEAVGQGDSEWR